MEAAYNRGTLFERRRAVIGTWGSTSGIDRYRYRYFLSSCAILITPNPQGEYGMTSGDAYLQAEAQRIQAAKDEARRLGFELLTPLAAAKLFQKSPEAVRKATRTGRVEVVFDLRVTDRNVAMIRLNSAIEYWGEPDEQRLGELRDNGLTMGVSSGVWNILHSKPLLELRDPAELEGEGRSFSREQVLAEVTRAYEQRVMNNVHRSDYVEAIVGVALADYGWTRKDPWDGWDCEHESEVPLEVKQSAAAQQWTPPEDKKRSSPRFDIAPRTGYEKDGIFVPRSGRNADIYVFAWHGGTEETADQREPASWEFYVMAEAGSARSEEHRIGAAPRPGVPV